MYHTCSHFNQSLYIAAYKSIVHCCSCSVVNRGLATCEGSVTTTTPQALTSAGPKLNWTCATAHSVTLYWEKSHLGEAAASRLKMQGWLINKDISFVKCLSCDQPPVIIFPFMFVHGQCLRRFSTWSVATLHEDELRDRACAFTDFCQYLQLPLWSNSC